MSASKYFIAVLPPSEIATEIIAFQKEIEVKYGATHAQKAPPHITLVPPFDAKKEVIMKLIEKVRRLQLEEKVIEIKLDNFQSFDHRTLFVDVARNEQFEHFCKSIKRLFNEQKIIPQRIEKHFFVPHITLANKDLKKKDFKLAEQVFKEKQFNRSFPLQELAILKFVEKKWKIFEPIKLN